MDNNYKSGFVTLIGRPNVGKSTLMNHLIGQKIAITSATVSYTHLDVYKRQLEAYALFESGADGVVKIALKP